MDLPGFQYDSIKYLLLFILKNFGDFYALKNVRVKLLYVIN